MYGVPLEGVVTELCFHQPQRVFSAASTAFESWKNSTPSERSLALLKIADAIEANAEYLSYVHLADSNRYQPGAGHLDFRAPLAALKRIGYDGWLTLECRILGDDRAAALARSADLVRRTWAEA